MQPGLWPQATAQVSGATQMPGHSIGPVEHAVGAIGAGQSFPPPPEELELVAAPPPPAVDALLVELLPPPVVAVVAPVVVPPPPVPAEGPVSRSSSPVRA